MKYEAFIKLLFQNLGLKKTYKGINYMIYILHLLSEDETSIEMVTKRLYAETAEKYKTSRICVEKNIRKVICMIWDIPENKELLKEILKNESLEKRPTNKTFLFALYQYAKLECIYSEVLANYQINYVCPVTGKMCNTCTEMARQIIEKYERDRV